MSTMIEGFAASLGSTVAAIALWFVCSFAVAVSLVMLREFIIWAGTRLLDASSR
jgi:hypothetical protein